jgi:hypothetical protein
MGTGHHGWHDDHVGFDYSVPITAFLAAAVLAALLRWIFRPSHIATGRPDSGPGADLGLLTPVLTSATRSAALAAKDMLSRQGIRCSLSRLGLDSYDLLVFGPDAEAASKLLGEKS